MASVILDAARISLLSNLSISVEVDVMGINESAESVTEVRRYAGGRYRRISRPGRSRTVGVEAQVIDRSTVDALRDWIGLDVLFRDPRGRKIYGTFAELQVVEYPGADLGFADARFTLQLITHTEVV